ncbi:hypothetical protein E6A50_03585, partial [Brachyspira hampsonii]|nr:hypothetical protein [Brachyspira hampsonii]
VLMIFILYSCNSEFLKPEDEVTNFDYTKYYINLDYIPGGGSQFSCEDILYSIGKSSTKDMLCIRGIVNPDSLTSIANCLENNKLLVYLDLRYASYNRSDGSKIWGNFFQSKTNLKAIYFPYDIGEIYYNVFQDCSNLEILIIPASLVTMRPNMFANCTKLTTVLYYGTKIIFKGGDTPGESWTGISLEQMTLYLANINRNEVSESDMNPNPTSGYGSWPKWAGYKWKEVKFKGEFDEKAIVR